MGTRTLYWAKKGLVMRRELFWRNDRQHQRRRMLGVVIDGLFGLDHPRSRRQRLARVEIAVELGKRRRRDLHADAVPLKKHLRRVPHVNFEFVNFLRLDQ